MSTQRPLNAIAIDVVGQYNDAAKHLVAAYRNGTRRAVAGASGRYEQLLNARPLPLLNDELKSRLIGTEQRVAGAVVDAVERSSEGAERLADRLAQGAVAGLEAFDARTAWTDDMLVTSALRTLNTPAANLSLQVAGKVAEVSRRLSERVAGEAPVVKVAKAAKKAVKRTAKTAVKRTRRAAAALAEA